MRLFETMRKAAGSIFSKREHPRNPAERWLLDLYGRYKTASGVEVTESKAVGLTSVYACIKIISEGVSSLPLILYERIGEREKRRAVNHNLYGILHDSPNPEMTSMEFREAQNYHLALRGNSYAMVERDQIFRIKNLWPVLPDRVRVYRGKDKELYYEISGPDGGHVTMPADYMLHLRTMSKDGLVGMDPLEIMREALGSGVAMQEYRARFFANDATASGVLEHPGALGDEAYERIQKSWEKMHRGIENAHKIGILEEGMKFKETSIDPEKAQMADSWRLSIADASRIWNIPIHMLAEIERGASYASVEQFNLGFVVHTLRPWLVRWEQGISKKLLQGEKNLFAEHLVDGLLRGDIKTRYEAYRIGHEQGWLCPNDIRAMENMNPLPEGQGGDTYLKPLNFEPAGNSPKDKTPVVTGGKE